jgi:hypothetical protein
MQIKSLNYRLWSYCLNLLCRLKYKSLTQWRRLPLRSWYLLSWWRNFPTDTDIAVHYRVHKKLLEDHILSWKDLVYTLTKHHGTDTTYLRYTLILSTYLRLHLPNYSVSSGSSIGILNLKYYASHYVRYRLTNWIKNAWPHSIYMQLFAHTYLRANNGSENVLRAEGGSGGVG